ncbi:MAG: UDP-galactopyranose mutase [Solirubrobacterales bacterium]|jgi:UDP-galactopyranose mutase|nr:UDP-galactopyranose mutase [Solirubrobacterales bacterium]
MSTDAYDVLVVGAGFAGSVMAERLASQAGLRVLVIDRRPHVAGNAFDELDEHGVLVHRYGPHIFHTNAERIVGYLSRFTDWTPYEHRVRAVVDGRELPMPINRTTLNELYGLDLRTEEQVRAFLESKAEPRDRIETSEDSVVARFGWELYETFFRGYTTKQWGVDPRELGAQVCARIPVRHDEDDRYFGDRFQQMPAQGYTAMFRAMLDHPGIDVALGVEYADVRDTVEAGHVVWTGPIDELYGFRFGRLPYRSLRFETRSRPTPDDGLAQSVAVLNHPDAATPWTRVTEYRHLTGQHRHPWTTQHVEFPCAEGDPYYPVPRPENRELYRRYEELSEQEGGVTFVGRLARYQYLNMDQVVGQALATAGRLLAARPPRPRTAARA